MRPLQKISKILGFPAALSAMFVAGYCVHRQPIESAGYPERAPLYYKDPMHPSYRSDKPGIAPDCGMALEPVYADSKIDFTAAIPIGAVRIDRSKQELIGIRTVRLSRQATSQTVHVVGRIAVDETRVDRVTALADGVVRSVSAYGTGSLVQQDDVLATYFVASRDIYNAMQAFVLASGTFDQAASAVRTGLINSSKATSRTDEELLKSYGVTAAQIRDLARTREVTRDIQFRTPIAGLVLARNVSRDQVVTRGTELFRIADISRVWVLAQVFENDLSAFHSGAKAQVRYGGHVYPAYISDARQFNPESRTLEIRLETENPGLLLRPDMFVDVQVAVHEPAGLTVPVESVLDAGRSKVVFVAQEGGVFVPREISVGREFDDHVQILSGVHEGERVVTSGTFLLDSESRLRTAVATGPDHLPSAEERAARRSASASKEADPVCGMPLPDAANEAVSYQGATIRFCSKKCKAKFESNPGAYGRSKTVASLQVKSRGNS